MITLTNVSYKYPEFSLEDVSFSLNGGEILAITGKNGSGKTTLINLLSGLIKAKSGQILIDGEALNKSKIVTGVVQQNPDNQIIFNKVYDDIAFTLKNYKINKEEFKDRIESALSEVNMLEFKNSETFSLSTGQKQRVVIANMLAIRPKLIIFDEATAYLDQGTKNIIYSLFKKLKEKGVSVIFATNALEEIVYADKVLVMKNGRIKAFDDTSNIIKNLDVFEEENLPLKLKLLNMLNLCESSDEEILKLIGGILK